MGDVAGSRVRNAGHTLIFHFKLRFSSKVLRAHLFNDETSQTVHGETYYLWEAIGQE